MNEVYSDPSKKLIIIEANPGGHRFYYVRLLALEAARQGRGVVLVTTVRAAESVEFNIHLESVVLDIRLLAEDDFEVRAITESAACNGEATIVIPDADLWLNPRFARLLLRVQSQAGYTVRLLVMRPVSGSTTRSKFSWVVKACVAAWLLHKTVFVAKLGPSLLDAARPRHSIPGCWVADPVADASTADSGRARSELGLREGTRYVGVLGVLDARKNIPLLIRALQDAEQTVGVLLVGQADAEMSAWVQQSAQTLDWERGRLVAHIGYQPTDVFDAAITAIDVLFVAYANEGSSGILGRAVRNRLPVVAAEGTWMGKCVVEAAIGYASVMTPPAVRRAVEQALTMRVVRWPAIASESGFARDINGP